MSNDQKTSTFTVYHDACKPSEWTAKDIMAFDAFVRTGSLEMASRLARLGFQLVLSERHEPKGGSIQEIGFVLASNIRDSGIDSPTEELSEIVEDDITEVTRIYRGPTEYAARIAMGDGEGNFEGYEYEVKATLAEAQAYFAEGEKPIEAPK